MIHKLLITIITFLLMSLITITAATAAVNVQCPADTDGIDTDGDSIVDNDIVCLHLSAGDGFINLADGTSLYVFGFAEQPLSSANVMVDGLLGAEAPAPTINVREGQQLFLNLTNVGMAMRPDLFDPHTIHWHGFPNAATVMDGEPMSSIAVNMGSTFTYYYNVAEPGTYMYHCHAEATEHMQMGMLGNLYVRPIQNMLPNNTDLNGFTHQTGMTYVYNDGDGSTRYDSDFPIQLAAFDRTFHETNLSVQPLRFDQMRDDYAVVNGRGYPDTIAAGSLINENGRPSQKINSIIEGTQSEKILLRISSLSTVDYFTVTALGIPMQVVGKDAKLLRGPDPDGNGPLLGKNLYYSTNSVTLGGGQSFDVILDTAQVPAGTYFLYTTNLNFLSNGDEDFGGMMTEIIIHEVI